MNPVQQPYYRSSWGEANQYNYNPLIPSIKFQIILFYPHTFLTEVVGRSC